MFIIIIYLLCNYVQGIIWIVLHRAAPTLEYLVAQGGNPNAKANDGTKPISLVTTPSSGNLAGVSIKVLVIVLLLACIVHHPQRTSGV